jgi:hypothetical protein
VPQLTASKVNFEFSDPEAFDGQTFDFNRIAPHGITFAQFFSTMPLAGITDYPVALAGAGTTMAIGGSLSAP